jgi:dCTP deaminase
MIKSDKWIKKMASQNEMIKPFEPHQIRDGKISFGTSSYGYDMRLGEEFLIAHPNKIIDPKNTDGIFKKVYEKNVLEIAPNSMVLGKSVEYFKIPQDIIALAFGKSTYARSGILVNLTPFEPGWEGFVTLSIINTNSLPAKVYINEGIAQVLFLQSEEPCEISYSGRGGKYQGQKDITASKI